MTTGRTPYYDSLKAAGLIDADYAFRAGILYDVISGRMIVPGTARLQRNGLAVPYNVDVHSIGALHLQAATEGTVMVLVRPEYSADATARTVIADIDNALTKGCQIHLAGGTTPTFVVRTTVSLAATAGVAGVVPYGVFSWVSGAFKNGAGLKVFVNGVQSGAGSTIPGATYIPATTPLYLGTREALARPLQETIARIVICKSELTGAQQITLQDELQNQIQYESQSMIVNSTFPTIGTSVWEARYGLLAGEQTMSAGQDIGQLASLKVSTGTHKMTTFTYNGQLAKGIQCVTAGNIILPDPRPTLGTTWAYQYYTAATTSWAAVTSATATVTLAAAGDRILWATQDGQTALRKY